MSRTLTALLASLTLATAIAAAQTPPAPPTQPQQEQAQRPDVRLTGCLVQGSSPSVFILTDAKMNPEDETEQGATYRVAPAVEDLFLRNHIDHKVTISGPAEPLTETNSGADTEIAEADLPQLDAKSIAPVADTCAQ